VEDARHLDRDVARAEHRYLLRLLFQVEEAITVG